MPSHHLKSMISEEFVRSGGPLMFCCCLRESSFHLYHFPGPHRECIMKPASRMAGFRGGPLGASDRGAVQSTATTLKMLRRAKLAACSGALGWPIVLLGFLRTEFRAGFGKLHASSRSCGMFSVKVEPACIQAARAESRHENRCVVRAVRQA